MYIRMCVLYTYIDDHVSASSLLCNTDTHKTHTHSHTHSHKQTHAHTYNYIHMYTHTHTNTYIHTSWFPKKKTAKAGSVHVLYVTFPEKKIEKPNVGFLILLW